MIDKKTEQLTAFCTEWREEIKRLEDELRKARTTENGVDMIALSVAITIRSEAVKRIEAIIGTAQP